jgi:hypothetical protein
MSNIDDRYPIYKRVEINGVPHYVVSGYRVTRKPTLEELDAQDFIDDEAEEA